MILRLSFVFMCVVVHRSQGSALHGACLSNDDCGTIDTFCRNQTCVCRENFAVWYDSCVQMPSSPLRCSKRQECHSKLGARSMCTKKSQCACKPFHHLHQGQCVKNRDLYDQCEHDHQCYCGADCEQKIACIHKTCSCKPGHKVYKIRRCTHDPSNVDDIPDEGLLSTTVHKHKSIEQVEHKSVPEVELKPVTQSEQKFSQQPEIDEKEKLIEPAIEEKEKLVEPTVERASTSSSNSIKYGRYFIGIVMVVVILNL